MLYNKTFYFPSLRNNTPFWHHFIYYHLFVMVLFPGFDKMVNSVVNPFQLFAFSGLANGTRTANLILGDRESQLMSRIRKKKKKNSVSQQPLSGDELTCTCPAQPGSRQPTDQTTNNWS